MKLFGDFLLGREDAQLAYQAIQRDYLHHDTSTTFYVDFEGVKVLAPSYCDELFGKLEEELPNRFYFDPDMKHALKAAFQTVEATRKVHFNFSPAPTN